MRIEFKSHCEAPNENQTHYLTGEGCLTTLPPKPHTHRLPLSWLATKVQQQIFFENRKV